MHLDDVENILEEIVNMPEGTAVEIAMEAYDVSTYTVDEHRYEVYEDNPRHLFVLFKTNSGRYLNLCSCLHPSITSIRILRQNTVKSLLKKARG